MKCKHCNGNLINYGFRLIGKAKKIKHQCDSCGYTKFDDYIKKDIVNINKPNNIKRYVITSIQNDTEVNIKFFNTMKNFCKLKSAELIMLPTKYLGHLVEANYAEEYSKYIVNIERNIGNNIKLLGDLHLLASLENPITGFDVVSKGKSIIIGHSQYQMKSLPTSVNTHPIILSSTGSVSVPNVNTNTKTGKKAEFNHNYGALYISVLNEGKPNEEFHIRHLAWDGVGFFDIDGYYFGDRVKSNVNIAAIVTGDEHISEMDELVFTATYGANGIVTALKPKSIVRHDVLSCNSISHHNKGKISRLNSMSSDNELDLFKELEETCNVIIGTTPVGTKSYIVASNHNEHLDRWLEDADSNLDKVNSTLYHWFMYAKSLEENSGITAFEIFFRRVCPGYSNIIFLNRDDAKTICDIEVHHHSDVGFNGSRGNIKQFSKHTCKTIIGHGHSPGVDKGCYQVGTSSKLKLQYNCGLSSWMQTHCLIYQNGKRQLINIINGKWYI